jgi:hypothetical protein
MKKEIKKEVNKPKKEVKEYKVVAMFNDEKFEIETNDIKEALLSIRPEMLNSEVDIKIYKGSQETERHLNLRQGRNLFINESFLDVFIANLMF